MMTEKISIIERNRVLETFRKHSGSNIKSLYVIFEQFSIVEGKILNEYEKPEEHKKEIVCEMQRKIDYLAHAETKQELSETKEELNKANQELEQNAQALKAEKAENAKNAQALEQKKPRT